MHGYDNSVIPYVFFSELEIDVNALRRGELVQGKNINKVTLNGTNVVPIHKTPEVTPIPITNPSKSDDVTVIKDGYF